LGDLRDNAQGSFHLWLNGTRTVNFLLVIIELFSLALTVQALLSKICRNRRFLKGWVTLSANFRKMGTSITIRLWTVKQRNDVAITLPLEVFTQRNFAADFFQPKLNFTGKTAKSCFVPPFGGLRGNIYGLSVARWKAFGRLHICAANLTFFCISHSWSRWLCSKGGGSL